MQNHLLQVLALFAMEPPISLDAEEIRNEKVRTCALHMHRKIRTCALHMHRKVRTCVLHMHGEVSMCTLHMHRKVPHALKGSKGEVWLVLAIFFGDDVVVVVVSPS